MQMEEGTKIDSAVLIDLSLACELEAAGQVLIQVFANGGFLATAFPYITEHFSRHGTLVAVQRLVNGPTAV